MSVEISITKLQDILEEEKPPFVLRTSDRLLFRKCRRLWGWMSHLQQGRVLRENPDYFWFGSGMHYALEDFHGLNLYGHPALAFLAYVTATQQAGSLPGTWMELRILGVQMMEYYHDQWLLTRDPLTTYEVDGIPQVEVNGAIDLGVRTSDGRRVLYGFTMDRIVIDEHGRLWVQEYKSAKTLRGEHLDVDDQVTAYAYCAWKMYGVPVAGVIYQQHRKTIPALPPVLANGKVSTDARKNTSSAMYAKMLTNMYGSVAASPAENRACYSKILNTESKEGDRFILRHPVERNEAQLLAFEKKVLMELEDMANPNLPLYPNPSWQCDFSCPMLAACVAMDDGSDWEYILDVYSSPTENSLTAREKEQIRWRDLLPEPHEVHTLPEGEEYQEMLSKLSTLQEAEASPEEQFLQELNPL